MRLILITLVVSTWFSALSFEYGHRKGEEKAKIANSKAYVEGYIDGEKAGSLKEELKWIQGSTGL